MLLSMALSTVVLRVDGAHAQDMAHAPSVEARAPGGAPVPIDCTAVRFDAAETGGRARPKFIFERELAFEARLEALADVDRLDKGKPYVERHIRAAVERHIAEELLSHLAIDPPPTESELATRTNAARDALETRVGGRAALESAAAAEALGPDEVLQIVMREARASLYIDRMVAPMLEPSDAELREVHRTANPFRDRPFEEVAPMLRRWYVGERLDATLQTFYQNARGRIHVAFM